MFYESPNPLLSLRSLQGLQILCLLLHGLYRCEVDTGCSNSCMQRRKTLMSRQENSKRSGNVVR